MEGGGGAKVRGWRLDKDWIGKKGRDDGSVNKGVERRRGIRPMARGHDERMRMEGEIEL